MAIKITLETGETQVLRDEISGIEEESGVASLFDGDLFLVDNRIVDGTENTDAPRITHAEWFDDSQDTSFHGYVLDRMNTESIDAIFRWADGDVDEAMIVSTIGDYYHGFQEAVNEQINLDGLEFVFGNGFNLDTLFNLVFREIVRAYLREHNLY